MSATTIVQFRLPDLGEGVVETEIIRWLVAPGASLVEDAPMVEVMTDKATVEIPAPTSGTVAAILAAEGDVVRVGAVIIEITAAAGADAAQRAPVNAPAAVPAGTPVAAQRDVATAAVSTGGTVQATPLVRKIARELGVDLGQVAGTGPQGRITEDDVRSFGASAGEPSGVSERIPLRGMRRQIAQHLAHAQRVPTVTVVEDADLTDLDAVRALSRISWPAYLARAVVRGLHEVPELNAQLDEARNEIVRFDAVHLGVAVQSDAGLVVPVIRDCQQLSLRQIDDRISELAAQAKEGTLAPEQLRGGTFTITSAGRFGGLFTTPLLNVPEVGILGLHRIAQRPAVVDGALAVRTGANVSVTFDHRALDGVTASRFVLTVIDALQHPQSLDE